MEENEFFELFLSNLRKDLDNENFVNSIEKLINSNKFNKTNYFKVLKGE